MDNYIMINGQKIELTKAQINQIIGKVDPITSIFEPKIGESYYSLTGRGGLCKHIWKNDAISRDCKKNYNCCINPTYMENLHLEQLLYRQLKQFSYYHKWNDKIWADPYSAKYYCYYSGNLNKWEISIKYKCFDPAKIYFISEIAAAKAIDEIIVPFYKEHPNFQPWIQRE